MLNRQLRVKVLDGRVIIGTFVCVDRDCNMILSGCREFTPDSFEDSELPRHLPLAMIPGKYAKTIEIKKQTEQRQCGRCSPTEAAESAKLSAEGEREKLAESENNAVSVGGN